MIREISALRDFLKDKQSVGFVPTMGALHEGHISLVQKARQECSHIVVSIFVNPTQFNDPKDFEKYPKSFDEDISLLERTGSVAAVFFPRAEELYADRYRFKVTENQESQILCGKHRPGHFDGVLTVVLKLLQIVRPDRLYLGEKDFQQLELIQGMVDAFFLDVEVVGCPIIREGDGLAMSSRNRLLTPESRERATALVRVLTGTSTVESAYAELQDLGFQVDYVEEWKGRRLAAAWLGGIRLIDNVALSEVKR